MLFRFAISTASLLGSVALFGAILWAASYVAKEAETASESIQGIPLSQFKRTDADPDKPNEISLRKWAKHMKPSGPHPSAAK